jgi:hypothetical protein
MITITSYLHRNTLHDIIRRWMYDDVRWSDAGQITRLVHFNTIYVSRYLQLFSNQLFGQLHRCHFVTRRTTLKGDLKDVIVTNVPNPDARIEKIIRNYWNHPERFFRETPFHATMFFILRNGAKLYIGSNRIKRVRRLAEKSARRIVDRIFETIKKHADRLADDRAGRMGISRQQMVTTPENMTTEFLKAENRLLEDLRYRRQIQDADNIMINDVAGIKVIVEESEQDQLTYLLGQMKNCEVMEVEPHFGKYNATNLIVRICPPKEQIISRPLGNGTLKIMERKGLDPEQANRGFIEFVRSGEKSVDLEIIVSNYKEMLESEIGRCIHEDRIIEQRLRQQYCGHLAKNIEYLMEYLFSFPASPQIELRQLPIKLWNRYLPDYFDDVLKRLFGIPIINELD